MLFRSRNKIVELLQDWGLLTVIDPEKIKEPMSPMNQIKVLNYKEKHEWVLEAKYQIGRKRIN